MVCKACSSKCEIRDYAVYEANGRYVERHVEVAAKIVIHGVD